MALAYRPPGVFVEELTSPNVAPILAAPASIGIIGLGQGYIERTEQIKLTGTGPISFVTEGTLPADATMTIVTAVKDTYDPGHAPNADGTYRGPGGGQTGAGEDYDLDLSGKTITRKALDDPNPGDGLIPDGRIVAVTYQYVPVDYFEPFLMEDLGSVQTRYGPAWSNGMIFSDLTYAAAIAFENGARFIVAQPLFARETPGDPSSDKMSPVVGGASGDPSDQGAYANPSTWADTFYSLRDIEDINVFVPVIGQSTDRKVTNAGWLGIAQTAQDHIKYLHDNDQYSVLMLGEDGTTTSLVDGEYPTKAGIRSDAATLRSRYGGTMAQCTAVVNTTKFLRQRPDAVSGTVAVGGEYMACALAGMLASRNASSPLTREQVSGFNGVVDYRSKLDKTEDGAAGLLVVEQKRLAIVVRHSITIDTASEQTRELSVVRAKHRMIESLRDTIDTQVIGKIIADAFAPTLIKNVVIGVLEALKGERGLVEYKNVQARQLTIQPTTIEVRFAYMPAFPINYVNIVFGIDLTTGAVTVQAGA
jgi:hypothetical protein